MKILINDEIDATLWNKFVNTNTLYRFEWLKIINDAYNLEPYFIIAYEDENFALLPSFKIKNKLVSLPFTYIVGYLSNSDILLNKLKDKINKEQINVQYKFVTAELNENSTVTGLIKAENKEIFWKSLSSNMRNQIKKSKKSGLTIKNENFVENFYEIFSTKMHSLGTPVHAKSFFENILNTLENTYIYTVYLNEIPIASMFCMLTHDIIDKKSNTLNITWAATVSKYDKYYTNYFLYFEVIDLFLDKGIKNIDLGTCKVDSSQYKFKKKWKPIFYEISDSVNKESYKDNKKMLFVSNLWKQIPLCLANYLGPKVRKYLV